MTWLAQVAHVMRKDVWQQRWLLLGYVLLCGFATLRAVDTQDGSGGASTLLILLGIVLLALAVQSDSPVRDDAFWPVLPLRRSAVAGAKLALLLGVVVVPLVGQLIVLVQFDLPALQFAGLLGRSAEWYLTSLAILACLAALMRNLAGVVLVVLVANVATSLLAVYVFRDRLATGSLTTDTLSLPFDPPLILLGAAASALIVRQYHTRVRRFGLLLALTLCVPYFGNVALLGEAPQAEGTAVAARSWLPVRRSRR